MAKRFGPHKMTARELAASAYAFVKWREQERKRRDEMSRLLARDDDTPDDVVDAINAGLLARYERECGR